MTGKQIDEKIERLIAERSYLLVKNLDLQFGVGIGEKYIGKDITNILKKVNDRIEEIDMLLSW